MLNRKQEEVMVHIEKSIVLRAPIQHVFAVVTDIPRTPQWVLMMQEVSLHTAGVVEAGTTFTEKHALLGQKAVFEKVITVYEPPRHYAVKSTSGPVAHTMDFTFESTENVTRLSMVIDSEMPADLSGLLGLGDMLLKIAEEQIEGDLRRLQKIVEQRG